MDVKTFNQRAIFALGLSALILIAYTQFSSLDLYIEDYYYDAHLKSFVWKSSWFAKQFMHGYLKDVIIVVGAALLIATLLDFIRPWKIISAWARDRLRFVAASAAIIPSTITGLKHFSVLHCPMDVERYNGAAPYVRLFDVTPLRFSAGHCFPAGHASTALWLAAFCVFWLPHDPKTAFRVFCAGLGAGFGLGWVQQMRGEHFLSHTLWSMWITTLIITLMLMVNKSLIEKSPHA